MTDFASELLKQPTSEKKTTDFAEVLLSPEPEAVKQVIPEISEETEFFFKDKSPARIAFEDAVTLGFQDEIAGAASATLQFGSNLFELAKQAVTGEEAELRSVSEAFGKTQKETEAIIKRERAKLPGAADIGIDIIGGLGAGKAVKAAAIAKGVLSRFITGLKLGSIWGGVSGFARAGEEERIKGTLTGAAFGAATGGTLNIALPTLFNAGSKFANLLKGGKSSFTSRETTALKRIFQAFTDDGIEIKDAQNRLAAWASQGGKSAALVDLGGENVKALARAMGGKIGPSRRIIQDEVEKRVGEQADNVANALAKSVSDKTNYLGAVNDLIKLRQGLATPLYEQAYTKFITITKDMAQILSRPGGQKAIANAVKIAKEEGEDLEALGFVKIKGKTKYTLKGTANVKAFDYVKRGYDDILNTFRDKITGKLNLDEFGRAVNNNRVSLVESVDKLIPEYAAARQVWSSNTESLNALNIGKDIVRLKPDIFTKRIENMTDGDLEFARAGAVKAIMDVVENTKDGANIVKRFFTTESFRKKMRSLFPDPQAADTFEAMMRRELDIVQTAFDISPKTGSQTQLRGVEAAEFSGGFIEELVAGKGVIKSISSAVSRKLAKSLADSVKKLGRDSLDEATAKLLIETPAPLDKLSRIKGRVTFPAGLEQLIRPAAIVAGKQ